MVGPSVAAALSLGAGLAGRAGPCWAPAPPGQLPPPSPAPSLVTAPISLLPLPPAPFLSLAVPPFIWHLCLLSPPPPPGCSCPSLCLPHPHHLRLYPCFPPSDWGLLPPPHLSQALCWPPLCGLGSLPPLWTPGCAGQTQVLVFPGICHPVAAREGAAGWLGWEGGALRGVPGVLSGLSRPGEYRGVRLWSEPSVQALRSGSRGWEGEEVGNGRPLSPEATCPLVSPA